MTEQPWNPITVHLVDRSLTVQVQADTPSAAAEALDPFVTDDVMFSGTSTTRAAAVQAILQNRLIAARANLEAAQAQYDHDLAAVQLHAETTAAGEQQ